MALRGLFSHLLRVRTKLVVVLLPFAFQAGRELVQPPLVRLQVVAVVLEACLRLSQLFDLSLMRFRLLPDCGLLGLALGGLLPHPLRACANEALAC